jgi:hypothetical protein
MPASDITKRCCPSYFKCTRCDTSCFAAEIAYISTTVFEGVSGTKVYVKSQFDDCDPAGTSGDKLGWLVDRSTSIGSVPEDALILTGVSGGDLYDAVGSPGAGGDACDNILDESVSQDNELWVVVCLCNKNDYFQILGGGSSASKVDTANNLKALKNKYNCDGDTHTTTCARQQYYAFNVIGATIDGSTNNATNPLDVGDYITLSGSLVDVDGSSAAVYGTPSSSTADDTQAGLVGNGSGGLKSATLVEDIFRVVDRTKQIKPDCATALSGYTARLKYPYKIDAYVTSPIVKTHATGGTSAGSAYAYLENCQDCLQAYFGFMLGDSSRTTKGLDDIIDMTNSTYNDTFSGCPSTWPCSVQISRTYSIDCTIAKSFSDQNNYARPIYPSNPASTPDFSPQIAGARICNDGPDVTGFGRSIGLDYEEVPRRNSLEGHNITDNIIGADRAIEDTSGSNVNVFKPSKITITAEYKRNYYIDQRPTVSSACPNAQKINSTIDFDYTLNSVSVSTDVTSNKGTIVASILSPTDNALSKDIANPPLIPCVTNVQGGRCYTTPPQTPDLGVQERYQYRTDISILDAPTNGYDASTNTYKGRLYIQRPDTGAITPFYKYIGYYGNHLADYTAGDVGTPDDYTPPEDDSARFTSIEREIFRRDRALVGKAVDQVIPFAPYIELAAGFNVNGFNHIKQKTRDGEIVNTTGGRSDLQSVTVDATAYKLYPGNSNTSKITFGAAGTDGYDLTGLPFYFDSYCTSLGSMASCTLQKALSQYSDLVGNQGDTNRLFVSRGNQNFIEQIEDDDTCGQNPHYAFFRDDGSGNAEDGETCGVLPAYCQDIYRFSTDSHMITASYNNKLTRMNGSRTGADGVDDDDTLDGTSILRYSGNGVNFRDSGLSGNAEEAVGIDSEWTSVFITAQDPWCRSCEGCISKVTPFTEGDPDNYLNLGILGTQTKT